MNTLQIESTLQGMKGKVFMHKTLNKCILRFSIVEDSVRIVTDVDDILIKVDQFKLALQDFLPVDESDTAVVRQSSNEVIKSTVIGSSALALKNILMDNIKKVQQDKDFIPQSAEIVQNVKSIIELAKTEVELYKAIKS